MRPAAAKTRFEFCRGEFYAGPPMGDMRVIISWSTVTSERLASLKFRVNPD
jgi:hypothetical protein